jgi:tripartite-type tricarboxylate transporter receptor subunit TctC
MTAGAAAAQNYPAHPIRVTYARGEIMFRMIASESDIMLRQPIIVDNRPGASSMIGAVDRAPTDGYHRCASSLF